MFHGTTRKCSSSYKWIYFSVVRGAHIPADGVKKYHYIYLQPLPHPSRGYSQRLSHLHFYSHISFFEAPVSIIRLEGEISEIPFKMLRKIQRPKTAPTPQQETLKLTSLDSLCPTWKPTSMPMKMAFVTTTAPKKMSKATCLVILAGDARRNYQQCLMLGWLYQETLGLQLLAINEKLTVFASVLNVLEKTIRV